MGEPGWAKPIGVHPANQTTRQPIMEQSIFIFTTFIIAAGILGGVGYMIGRGRGRGPEGFALGAFFGPIGWIIAAVLSEKGAKCPACLGVVPAAAIRCKHCGSDLGKTSPSAPTPAPAAAPVTTEPSAAYFVMLNGKAEGPFNQKQLSVLLDSGKVDRDTACAVNGVSNWQTIGEFL